MASKPSKLGELQLAVMNVLWSRQQATVHDVLAWLPEDRRPAYTTVLSVLQTLEKHGLVSHESAIGSRMFLYRPVISAYDARGEILQDVLNCLFAGSPALLIRHLLETEGFTLQELRDIRGVIDQREIVVTGKRAS